MSDHKLKLGDPVILTEDVDQLTKGTVGMLNSISVVEGIEYAFFMPIHEQVSHVLRMAKLEYLDEEEVQQYPELKALLEQINGKDQEENSHD